MQRSQATTTCIRLASSRYSSPSKRAFTAAPAQAPSFVVDTSSRSEHGGAQLQQETVRHPLDARAAQIAHEEKQQFHLRRMRFAGMGLLLSIFGMAALIYNLDLDDIEQAEAKRKKGAQQLDASDEANARFQGREVHIIGAGDGKRIVAKGVGEDIELVETGTSSVPHFPRTIYLPTSTPIPGSQEKEEQYTLLGLGIRTVSFLSIQVYVVGMYIRTTDLGALQEKLIHNINDSASTLIPSEKAELEKRLLDPAASREIWTELLKVPGLKTAFRIAPTRNTDFGHLKDGWITGITNRTREVKQLAQGASTEFEEEEFGQSISEFKSIFTGGKAPKGSVMVLARDQGGILDVLFQEKAASSGDEKVMQKLGSVKDERVSKMIWLGYLGGDKVSSEAARKGIAEGCVAFAARPVGSAETMIR